MILVLATLLGSGLAGCRPDPAERVNPPITVFLTPDMTPQQKQAVEQRLRGVPDVAEVTFESREQAYARFKEQFKDDPELLDGVRPDTPPRVLQADPARPRRLRPHRRRSAAHRSA